jgi:hypothetical protein
MIAIGRYYWRVGAFGSWSYASFIMAALLPVMMALKCDMMSAQYLVQSRLARISMGKTRFITLWR